MNIPVLRNDELIKPIGLFNAETNIIEFFEKVTKQEIAGSIGCGFRILDAHWDAHVDVLYIDKIEVLHFSIY